MVNPTSPPVPTTISNLPTAVTPLGGGEYIPIVQNGITSKITSAQLLYPNTFVSGRTISGAAGTISTSTLITNIYVNLSLAVASFTLPAGGTLNRIINAIDYLGNAGIYNATITVQGGGTMNGLTTQTLAFDWQTLSFIDNGTNWNIL